jgi:formylglycine-generating enzyme required for sulfatase activity
MSMMKPILLLALPLALFGCHSESKAPATTSAKAVAQTPAQTPASPASGAASAGVASKELRGPTMVAFKGGDFEFGHWDPCLWEAEGKGAKVPQEIQYHTGPCYMNRRMTHQLVRRDAIRMTIAPFEIDSAEVTIEQYEQCEKAGVCAKVPRTLEECVLNNLCPNYQGDPITKLPPPPAPDFPITRATWHDAKKYCEWAGKRLPTEPEWEFAARNGDARYFPWGDTPPDNGQLATEGNREVSVSRLPIHNGLRGMFSNAGEWLDDESLMPWALNPQKSVRSGTRFIYHGKADGLTNPQTFPADYRGFGFRCARSDGPPTHLPKVAPKPVSEEFDEDKEMH